MKCDYCGTRDVSGVCPKCGGYTPEEAEAGGWEVIIPMVSLLIATLLAWAGYRIVGNALIEQAAKLVPIFSPF
jgi:hypothetical protein